MNPNWLGVISAVLAFVAFFVSYRIAKTKPVRTRVILSIATVFAAIPGASLAAYYAHILPEATWYYEFRSGAGTELLVVLVGLAGGLVASLLPRVILILPLLAVAGFTIAPIIKPFVGPIPADVFEDEWDGEVCLQSTSSTCGAASTATILKQLGTEVKEAELAREAHSYSGGTEAWYLARAARKRGFKVRFDFEDGFSPEGGLPAVVGVKLGVIGHFIAVLGKEGDQFLIGDPLRGRELLSLEKLRKRYVFTGFHMRISK